MRPFLTHRTHRTPVSPPTHQAKRFTRFSELISSLRVAQADNNVARGKLVSQMHEVRRAARRLAF